MSNNEIEIPLRRFKTLLVVDLEATCWAEGRGPREDMETIEFGAVLVRTTDLQPIDERSWFIRPMLHPILSEFCTELTSITQEQVDNAQPFEQVCELIAEWLEPHRERLGWGSWGNYDRHQLQRDAARLGMQSPLGPFPHTNLKDVFTRRHRISRTKRPGMQKALQMCGLSLEGLHHRGIDDARNIARMLPWLIDPEKKIRYDEPLPIMSAAIAALGSEKEAKRWLRTPCHALDGKRPCDVMKSAAGDQEVRRLLEQMNNDSVH